MTATTTTPRRTRRYRYTETADYAQMCQRMVRGLGKRVGNMDVDELPAILEVAEEAERVFRAAGLQLHDAGYSWAEIAARLGVTRNSARRRCMPQDSDPR